MIKSLTQGESITVFNDVYFSPLSIQRLVELLEIVSVKCEVGIFNLGAKDGISKADFAFALAEVLDLPLAHMSRGGSGKAKLIAYRPKGMCMDSSRFERVFGIQLPILKEEIYSMKAAYDQLSR